MSLPTRQIGGHKKAAINNPRVSEEAKEHSPQAIDDLEFQPETQESRGGYDQGKDETRVNSGYKANLKNPNVSEDPRRERAQQLLEEKDTF